MFSYFQVSEAFLLTEHEGWVVVWYFIIIMYFMLGDRDLSIQ